MPKRYNIHPIEKWVLILGLLYFAVGIARSEPHPFIKFQAGLYRVLDSYAWEPYDADRRLNLCRAIWNGCGQDYTEASYVACIGVMESHYTRRERGKSYNKTRGYHGCHNATILAEVRRQHLPGSRRYWLRRLWTDDLKATELSAARWAFIARTYPSHQVALRQWVTGNGWRHTKKDRIRSEAYVHDVEYLRMKYF